MKGTKSSHGKGKRSAEDWVDIARGFGEKCVTIQHDSKLDIEQKLEKQKALSKEMIKEIQDDSHLSDEDKNVMIKSIKSYIEDWSKMHDILEAGPSSQASSKKSKK